MLTAADDLDDLVLGLKLARGGDRGDRLLHRGGGILVDAAAGLADQEGDDLVGAVAVQAGEIGVAGREAVDEALLDEEIERAIDRDRREAAPAGRRHPVREVIGAHGAMVGMQRLEGLAPDRRQAQAALAAKPLGTRQRVRGVQSVIMGMATGAVIVVIMGAGGMFRGVWLHVCRVA